MQKIICKKTYDTETGTLVKKVTDGQWGDPRGYEVSLFETPEGLYFLYTNGGAESPYPNEGIKRLSKKAAEEWLAEN